MHRLLTWGRTAAEAVAALMLAALFATFVLQIFARYVLNAPLSWTLELTLALWIWIVFWGNAFVVRDRDHVTFDILYLAVPAGARRWFALAAALAIAVGLLVSIVPTWDYIDFLRIKRSATLRIPMRDIFSIYMLFLVVVAARYLWRAVQVWRHRAGIEDTPLVSGDDG